MVTSSTYKALLLMSSFMSTLGATHRSENSMCQFNVNLNTADIANTSYVRMMKNVKLPISGRTYRYAINPPLDGEKPYILFLHGFPESSYSWVNQIDYFTRHGYGIIAPDLLGTGGTDKPTELDAYSLRTMSSEIAELLQCEGIEKVVAVSHDLGSFLLSRFHTYHPAYLSALVYLDISYIPPGLDLNLTTIEAANNASQAGLGYPLLGYWPYHNQPDAHVLMDKHLDSLFSLYYTSATPTTWIENFNTPGKLQEWLAADKRAEFGNEYITNSTREIWKSIVKAQGGLEAPLKWYKAFLQGVNSKDETELEDANGMIEQPVMFVTAQRDAVGVQSEELKRMVPFAMGMSIRSVDAGHFVHLENAREVNRIVHKFLEDI
ncbi:Alpha/Beta hydrolase protein [Boeremia exigua]|uniref:Alpha/Beta hydrolase protein n=1 Tax=Boeremia exigua TaxID=749465 RepID=UPI001E8E18E6|nr:Alpha/Beta hydrolase protein [Boeremia exigua]KAH6613068.1 Alpha/Beta hydrolase protein [Boeremia exigua]